MNKLKQFGAIVSLMALSAVIVAVLGWACLNLVATMGLWGVGFFFSWLYATLKLTYPVPGEFDERGFPLVMFSFLLLCAFCTLIA
jgi:hypothetical protein